MLLPHQKEKEAQEHREEDQEPTDAEGSTRSRFESRRPLVEPLAPLEGFGVLR
jgi:hypothetical protein